MRRFLPILVLFFVAIPAYAQDKKPLFEFKKGDRVAWVGSSSTNIGVWPKTMEFLLRTRHPELQLTFKRYSTGGGTFATGLQNLDKWLADGKPTVVFFNYGSNDAAAAEKGLPPLKDNIATCVAKAEARRRARTLLGIFRRPMSARPGLTRCRRAQVSLRGSRRSRSARKRAGRLWTCFIRFDDLQVKPPKRTTTPTRSCAIRFT